MSVRDLRFVRGYLQLQFAIAIKGVLPFFICLVFRTLQLLYQIVNGDGDGIFVKAGKWIWVKRIQ